MVYLDFQKLDRVTRVNEHKLARLDCVVNTNLQFNPLRYFCPTRFWKELSQRQRFKQITNL